MLDIRLPILVDQSLALLGKTASPLALFVIGGSLVGMGMSALNLQSGLLVAFKVILMPLLIYCLLRILLVSQEMLCRNHFSCITDFGILGRLMV